MSVEKTCGNCRHWKKQPTNPLELGAKVANGECWCNPPQLVALHTPQGIAVNAMRPVLPETAPACGQHAEKDVRLALAGS